MTIYIIQAMVGIVMLGAAFTLLHFNKNYAARTVAYIAMFIFLTTMAATIFKVVTV